MKNNEFEIELLNRYTSDEKVSKEILEKHNLYFSKIKKYKDFDLENILIELPYIDELKKCHLEKIEILDKNGLNPDLIFMTTYLTLRSFLGKIMILNNLTQPVIDKINTLFIDIFPSKIPDMLKNGLLIQSKKSVLFDNVNKILIYDENYNEKETLRIFIFYKDGMFSNASLSYSSILGKGIDEIDNMELTGKYKNVNAVLFRKALLFSIIFSLLIKTEKTPISVKDTNKSESIKKLQTVTERKKVEGWIEKTIYINKKYLSKSKSIIGTLYKDDKVLKKVTVSDHFRRKQNSDDEYIFISSFPSTRWVIDGNKKITYYFKEDN